MSAYNKRTRSFHPTGKTEQFIENGSSALGSFFCLVLAAIVVIWLCADTSAGLTESLHRPSHVSFKASNSGFWPLDVLKEWM